MLRDIWLLPALLLSLLMPFDCNTLATQAIAGPLHTFAWSESFDAQLPAAPPVESGNWTSLPMDSHVGLWPGLDHGLACGA